MHDQIDKRHTELKAENDAGQRQLAELEARMQELQVTLYRISGAMQVLEELRQDASSDPPATGRREIGEQVSFLGICLFRGGDGSLVRLLVNDSNQLEIL